MSRVDFNNCCQKVAPLHWKPQPRERFISMYIPINMSCLHGEGQPLSTVLNRTRPNPAESNVLGGWYQ